MDPQLLAKMDKAYSRLEMYNKKNQRMGLDNVERRKYAELVIEFMQFKLVASDEVFDTLVLPQVLYGQAKKLSDEIEQLTTWRCDLLIYQDRMNEVLEAYKKLEDKDELIKKILSLYNILQRNLKKYFKSLPDPFDLEDISLLLSEDTDPTVTAISDFLEYKFEVLYTVLEVWEEIDNEKIKEKS